MLPSIKLVGAENRQISIWSKAIWNHYNIYLCMDTNPNHFSVSVRNHSTYKLNNKQSLTDKAPVAALPRITLVSFYSTQL